MFKPSVRTAAIELFGVATFAWLLSVLAQPHPIGVDVTIFSLKWFVYTYIMALVVYVLVPVIPVFGVGALIVRAMPEPRRYWTAFQVAIIVAAIWAVVGNWGTHYGKCRETHSASECQ